MENEENPLPKNVTDFVFFMRFDDNLLHELRILRGKSAAPELVPFISNPE